MTGPRLAPSVVAAIGLAACANGGGGTDAQVPPSFSLTVTDPDGVVWADDAATSRQFPAVGADCASTHWLIADGTNVGINLGYRDLGDTAYAPFHLAWWGSGGDTHLVGGLVHVDAAASDSVSVSISGGQLCENGSTTWVNCVDQGAAATATLEGPIDIGTVPSGDSGVAGYATDPATGAAVCTPG